jgi:hypothetical protein
MDAAHRPVAAVMVTDLMLETSLAQPEQLRRALEQSGIVELGERGTRRWSPWRRALARCQRDSPAAHQSPAAAPALSSRDLEVARFPVAWPYPQAKRRDCEGRRVAVAARGGFQGFAPVGVRSLDRFGTGRPSPWAGLCTNSGAAVFG